MNMCFRLERLSVAQLTAITKYMQ